MKKADLIRWIGALSVVLIGYSTGINLLMAAGVAYLILRC